MEELERVAGAKAAQGRVILAHLGNGASLAAVRDGHSIDTSMGFTPAGGIPMGTRTGDLDPGVARYLMDREKMSPAQFNKLINHQSGLLGMSETSSDMRELLRANRANLARPRRSACFAIRSKNGSARSQRRWAELIRWCSPAASARMPAPFAPAFAQDWNFWESTSIGAKRSECRRDIRRRQPCHRACDSHRRARDDRQIGLPTSTPRLRRAVP